MAYDGIGLADEHAALADSIARWADATKQREHARSALEAHPEALPDGWQEMADHGWLGLHLPEEHGGGGAGLLEAAVVLEAVGRAAVPGPALPTMLAAALVARAGTAAAQTELLPGLADGRLTAAIAVGDSGLLLGGGVADVAVVPLSDGRWAVIDLDDAVRKPMLNLDGARRVMRADWADLTVPAERVLTGLDDGLVRHLAVTLAAAEASGIAAWCLESSTEYAKVREQFGRPIGQFQAIKHLCADMLVRVEMARAAAWDAARAADDPDQRPIVAALAGAIALDSAVSCAKDCIQVHGGIGYTWEHDAHLYLRRATSLRQLFGPTEVWRGEAANLAQSGARRRLVVDLPPEAEEIRDEVRAFVDEVSDLKARQQHERLVETGYLVPHWPEPYGRGADAAEQIVIAEEFEKVGIEKPRFLGGFGDWVLPTLIQYGSAEQKERFILPTMLGDITWCQLFSEPGAGSDLASLGTKAERVDGGWVLNGQKVWNSFAQMSSWGICLARTDPSAPKHDGITYFLVDMASEGIDVRPLREMTGHSIFNEVFLNDVFVPDELVVGEVNKGWPLARNTLANERVVMGKGMLETVDPLLQLAGKLELTEGGLLRMGELVCQGQALTLLKHRATLRQVSGTDPGPAVSVVKLMTALHEQDVSEFALDLLGPEGATFEGDAGYWGFLFMSTRAMTLVGGTTEVQRNLIGERILGLPRDDAK